MFCGVLIAHSCVATVTSESDLVCPGPEDDTLSPAAENVVVSCDANSGLVDSMDAASLEVEASLDVELTANATTAPGNDSTQLTAEYPRRQQRQLGDEEDEEVSAVRGWVVVVVVKKWVVVCQQELDPIVRLIRREMVPKHLSAWGFLFSLRCLLVSSNVSSWLLTLDWRAWKL
jgi:hypothetical protein